MRSRLALLLAVCAAVPVTAQKKKAAPAAPSEVEITAEPNHHLAFQNSYVRVFQVEVAPRSATLMHRHRHDYIFVTLGDSEVSSEVEGKSPVTLTLHDGETRFTPGNFAHIARNLARTPFRNVTIEFLRNGNIDSAAPKPDDQRGLQVLHGGTKEILFVKDGVRVSEVELQIAGVLPEHRQSNPALVVAVSDLLLRDDVVGKPTSNVEMKSGDVKWIEGGFSHNVTNVGKQGAKLIFLEF
jgi:quercetin dioxygenase-like cupin family protein